MARASITIEDDEGSGGVTVNADFGDQIDQKSHAHAMVYELLSGVLGAAKTYTKIEDTAGDMGGRSAEPSAIVVAKA